MNKAETNEKVIEVKPIIKTKLVDTKNETKNNTETKINNDEVKKIETTTITQTNNQATKETNSQEKNIIEKVVNNLTNFFNKILSLLK